MTLRVALDATPLLDRPTGVGVLTRALLDRLSRTPAVDPVAFSVSFRGRHRLGSRLPTGMASVRRPMAARPLRTLWRHRDWPPIEWWTGPVDVVHGVNFVVPPARAAARLVTVHDLTAVHFPELCTADVLAWPDLLRRAVADGAWVHTPSATVAAEVADAFAVPTDRLVVVANGVDVVPAAAPGAGRRLAGTERYILAVGTLEPRKDLPGLVRAFAAVGAALPDVGLVLAGADGWGADAVHQAVTDSPHRNRIRCLGWVDDDTRAALLRDAAVLAFPSRYEGFGLPPLEAMSVGVPVVATAVGAVPEVVGDAACLVPFGDDDALAAGLVRVLDDEGVRAGLTARGHDRVAHFSWDECATSLLAAYQRMAAGRGSGAP